MSSTGAVDWWYITGCDTGFGAEAARMFAAKKHHVFAGHFTAEAAEKLKEDGNGYIVPLQLDVTKQESVDAAAEKIKETLGREGRLTGLVNNAGLLCQVGFLELMSIDNHTKMMDVNYFGTVRVTLSVLPLIRKTEGRIVNVASIAGRVAFPSLVAYSATKYAVEGFNDGLRKEMQGFGVTVHLVEPGVFSGTNLYATYGTGFDKTFASASPELQAEYGKKFNDQTRDDSLQVFSFLSNKDTSKVPRAYYHALTAKNPYYRYRVGWDSKSFFTIVSWLHESLQDLTTLPLMTAPAGKTLRARWNTTVRYGGWPLMRKIIYSILGYYLYRYIKRRFAPIA